MKEQNAWLCEIRVRDANNGHSYWVVYNDEAGTLEKAITAFVCRKKWLNSAAQDLRIHNLVTEQIIPGELL